MKKITLLLLLLTTTLSFSQVSLGNGDDGDGLNSPPISPYYGTSYSQSIYLASEINTSGDVTSIEYALNAGTDFSSADDNVDVWIGHTAKTAFDSTSDWVDVTTLSHVLVDGTVTVANDVLTITFSSPFTYNGTDNLVVAIDANEAGYGISSDYVLSTNGSGDLTLDQRSDSTNSDPTSPAAGILRQNRGNITFNGITQACPDTSALALDAVTTTTATISWTAGGTETAWEYVVEAYGSDEPSTSGTATTSNSLTLSGLTANTLYDVYVRADCGAGDFSSWVKISFATDCDITDEALSQDFDTVANNDANCWEVVNQGDTNAWTLVTDTTTGNTFWNLLYSSSAAHDDYLYSPKFSVIDGVTDAFNFKGWNPNTLWPEVIDVLVVDAIDNSLIATLATDLNLPEPDATTGEATIFTYDLSSYEGQDVRIAFYSSTLDRNAARLDDFTLDAFSTLGTSTNTLEGFTLYPTIVKEELNFRSQNKVEAITVFNLLGQKVFSGAPNTNNSSINLSNLRPGVYVVKVSAEGKIGSYKIVKE